MNAPRTFPLLAPSLLCLAFAVPGDVSCQEAASDEKASAESKASVSRIHESRSRRTGRDPSGTSLVTLKFEAPVEKAELVQVKLSEAEDSLGNNLIDPDASTTEAAGRTSALSEKHEITMRLRLPAREARTIAKLTGTVVFQDPDAAKDPVTLDFSKSPGEYIPNKKLKKAGISVAHIDQATFDEKGWKLVSDRVLGKTGRKNISEAEARKAAIPVKMIFQATGGLMFVIDDPEKQLIKLEGLDTDNEIIGLGVESSNGLWLLASLNDDRKAKSIRLHLRSENAEIARKFTIKDVPLP